jgi:VCBS repeat-containing protein
VALSDDAGRTWRFVDPTTDPATDVWSVVYQGPWTINGATYFPQGIIDIIGEFGELRSFDGGLTWGIGTGLPTTFGATAPAVNGFTPGPSALPDEAKGIASVAVSPVEPYVLYAVSSGEDSTTTNGGDDLLYESVDGGRSWTKLSNPKKQGRVDYLTTNLRSPVGGQDRFDLWFGDVLLFRIAGRAPADKKPGGGTRIDPVTQWNPFGTGASSDVGGLAFDLSNVTNATPNPADKVPVIYANDSGTFVYQPINNVGQKYLVERPSALTWAGHGFANKTKVKYRTTAGSDVPGLKDAKTYFVIKLDDDTFRLAASGDDVDARLAVQFSPPPPGSTFTITRVTAPMNSKMFTAADVPALLWDQATREPHATWVFGMAGVNDGANVDIYSLMQDDGVAATSNAQTAVPTWHQQAGYGDGYNVAADVGSALYSGNGGPYDRLARASSLPGAANLVANGADLPDNASFPDGGATAERFAPSFTTWNNSLAPPNSHPYAIATQDDLKAEAGRQNGGVFYTNNITATPVMWLPLGTSASWPQKGNGKQVGQLQYADRAGTPVFFLSVGDEKFVVGRALPVAEQLWKLEGTTGAWMPINGIPGGGVFLWAVNRSNADQMYVGVLAGGGNEVQFYRTTNGGGMWKRDEMLEKMMTANDAVAIRVANGSGAKEASYRFNKPYLQPSLLAFDPQPGVNGMRIVAGGRDSGVFLSTDGGVSWRLLTNPSDQNIVDGSGNPIPDIPRPRSAFFSGNDIYIGTQGRGIWRISPDFRLPKDSDESSTKDNNSRDNATQLPNETTITRTMRTIYSETDVDYYKFTAQVTGIAEVGITFDGLRGLLKLTAEGDTADMPPDGGLVTLLDGVDNGIAGHLNNIRIRFNTIKGKVYYVRISSADKPAPLVGSLRHTNYYDLKIQNFSKLGFVIDGGDGSNALYGADQVNTWTISAADTGTLDNGTADNTGKGNVEFKNVGNLVGGADVNRMKLLGGGSVTGMLDGGPGHAGLNTIEYTSDTTARITSLNSGSSRYVAGGVRSFANFVFGLAKNKFELKGGRLEGSGFVDGGGGDSTLVAGDGPADWLITGTDSGQVTGITDGFTGFDHLVGGDGPDQFVVAPDSGFAGTLQGGAGSNSFVISGSTIPTIDGGDHSAGESDVLDLSGMTSPISINLAAPGFTNIDEVIGNNVNSTLVGANVPNTWVITGENQGTVDGLGFAGFNNLTGGASTNTFDFTSPGQAVLVTDSVKVALIDDPTGTEGGTPEGELESERSPFGDPPITGDVLARARATNPGAVVSIQTLEDQTLVGTDTALGAASDLGQLQMQSDGTYSYQVRLDADQVQGLAEGDSVTDSFAYTFLVNTQMHSGTLAVTITRTAAGLVLTDNVDNVNITGTVTGGGGDNTFKVLATALITATLAGGAGNNTLVISDLNNPGPEAMQLVVGATQTTMTEGDSAPLNYTGMTSLVLDGEIGNDTITLDTTAANLPIFVSGGPGFDELDIDTRGLSYTTGQGLVTLNDTVGMHTFPIHFDNTTERVNLLGVTVTDPATDVLHGLQSLSDFGTVLAGLGTFADPIPLTPNGVANPNSPLTPGDLVNPGTVVQLLHDALQGNTAFAAHPTASNLQQFLSGWSGATSTTPFGNLTVTVPASSVEPIVIVEQDGTTRQSVELQLSATNTSTFQLANVQSLMAQGLFFDPAATYDLTTNLNVTLSVGLGATSFARLGTMSVDLEGSNLSADTPLAVGVLGTQVTDATLEMNGGLIADVGTGDEILDPGQLETAAQGGLSAVGALTDVEEQPGMLSASFTVTPVDQAGLNGVDGGDILLGHAVLAAPAPGEVRHLFRDFPSGPPVALPDGLGGFARLRPADLLDPVRRFAIALDGLEASSVYNGLLPLVQNERVGDLLTYGDALRSGLLNQVTSGGVPTFTTIQQLLATLNAGSTTALTATYDPTAQHLTFGAVLSQTLASVTVPFDQTLDLGLLTGVTPNPTDQVTLTPQVALNLAYGMDFTPTELLMLNPSHPALSAQTGALSGQAVFTLKVGSTTGTVTVPNTATTTSQLIDHINAALATVFGTGVVTASIDTMLGADNPRLKLSSTQSIMVTDLGPLVNNFNVAGEELGLVAGVGVFDINHAGFLNTLPMLDISSGTNDIRFSVQIGSAPATSVTVARSDTAGVTDPNVMAGLLNTAFAAAGIDSELAAVVVNGRVSLKLLAAATSLSVYAPQDNPFLDVLGFLNGQRVVDTAPVPEFFDAANTQVAGTVRLTWHSTAATAQYGFVEIALTDASAQGTVTLTSSLTATSATGLVDVGNLTTALTGAPAQSGALNTTDPTNPDYVTNDALRMVAAGAGHNVQLAVRFAGHIAGQTDTLANQLVVAGTMTDIFDPSTLTTTVTAAAQTVLDAVSSNGILPALRAADAALHVAAGNPLLNINLPLIGLSGNGLNNYVSAFDTLIQQLSATPVTSLQQLDRAFNELMGIDVNSSVFQNGDPGGTDPGVRFRFNGNSLDLGLRFVHQATHSYDFNLDVYSLAQLVSGGIPASLNNPNIKLIDANRVLQLDVPSTATVAFDIPIDFSVATPAATLGASSAVTVDFHSAAQNLSFLAGLGVNLVQVSGGSLVFDADAVAAPNDQAEYKIGFGGAQPLSTPIAPASVTVGLTGAGQISLPLYTDPSLSTPIGMGPLVINLLSLQGVLDRQVGSVQISNAPDLTGRAAAGVNSLLRNTAYLADGLDRVLKSVESAIIAPFQALVSVPLVGDGLQSVLDPLAADFDNLRANLRAALQRTYSADIASATDAQLVGILREVLFDLFATNDSRSDTTTDNNHDGLGARLGFLQPLPNDGNTLIDPDDIVVTNFGGPAGVRFDMHLAHSFTINLPFALGFTSGGVALEQLLQNFGLTVSARNAAQLQLTWDFRFGFGVNESDLLYVNSKETSDIANPLSGEVPELTTKVQAGLPGLSSPGGVGLLDGSLSDGTTPSVLNITVPLDMVDPNGTGRLTPFAVQADPARTLQTQLSLQAALNLHVTTNATSIGNSLGGILGFAGFGMPQMAFDFHAEEQFATDPTIHDIATAVSAAQTKATLPPLQFNHVNVDADALLRSFVAPLVSGFAFAANPVLEVLGPVAGFFTQPIPVINDLASFFGYHTPITLLSILGGNDTSLRQFTDRLDALANLATSLGGLGTSQVMIDLGSWQVDVSGIAPVVTRTQTTNIYDQLSAAGQTDIASDLQELGVLADGTSGASTSGVHLALLDPGNVLNVFLGQPYQILSFDPLTMHLAAGFNFGFDFQVLNFNVGFHMSADAALAFGYDSTGLQQLLISRRQGVTPNAGDLLDGFYLNPKLGAPLSLSFSFYGSGGINITTPQIGPIPPFTIFAVQATVSGRFGLSMSLIDPNGDGRVRFNEMYNLTAGYATPGNIFSLYNIVGGGQAHFSITGTILGITLSTNDLPVDFTTLNINFSTQNFFSTIFGVSGSSQPVLAQVVGSGAGRVLRINAGPFAYARVNGGTSDATGARGWSVSSMINPITMTTTIIVRDGLGNHTSVDATGIAGIVFRGSDADDSIDFSGLTLPIPVDAWGGYGNDTIIGGGGNDLIRGGPGSDSITGGSGDNALYGGGGNDVLSGGSAGGANFFVGTGNDVLVGGTGPNDYLYGTTADERRNGWGQDIIKQSNQIQNVTDNGSGLVRVTAAGNGLANGDVVTLVGIGGVSGANGTFAVTNVTATTFDLLSSTFSGTYVGGTGGFYQEGRRLRISDVEPAASGTAIVITSTGHGLATGDVVSITGVAGVVGANGSFTVTRIDNDTFSLDGTTFGGTYDPVNGPGFIVVRSRRSLAEIQADPARLYKLLTNTLDFSSMPSTKPLRITLNSAGVTVALEGTAGTAASTVTVDNQNLTILGGKGDDRFIIQASTGPLTILDGGEGSDTYEVDPGVSLGGQLIIHDTGVLPATDAILVKGKDDPLNPDIIGVTNKQILFGSGQALTYAVAGVDSGIEAIRLDLQAGNDIVNIESTPATTTLIVNGGLGNDTINVGVAADSGTTPVPENLSGIAGSPMPFGPGPLQLYGFSGDTPTVHPARDADVLRVFDTTDTNGTTGTLTGTTLTGLGMGAGIVYGQMSLVDVQLGQGNNQFTIANTAPGAITKLNTGPGNDVVNVQAMSGHTFVDSGAGNDTVNIHDGLHTLQDMLGLLTVTGGVPQASVLRLVNGAPQGTSTSAVDEVQQVTVDATGGTFMLSLDGATAGPLAYNISATDLATALANLATIGAGNVMVTQTGNVYRIEFVNGKGGQAVDLLTAHDLGLTNGLGAMHVVNVDDSGTTANTVGLLTSSSLTGLSTQQVNAIQTIFVNASQGHFTLAYAGATTAPLAYNISAADLQTALTGLTGIKPGDVAVTRNDKVIVVRFQGNLANQNIAPLVATNIDLMLALEQLGGGTQLVPGTATVSSRVAGTSATKVNDMQVVTVNATGGSYKLSLLGGTVVTAAIPYDASADVVQQALQAAIAVQNPARQSETDVLVTRYANVYLVAFQATLGRFNTGAGVDLLQADTSNLTGTVTVTNRMDGLNYYGIENLNIDTGTGNTIFSVQGTSAGSNGFAQAGGVATTNVRFHGGASSLGQLYVSSNADLDFASATPAFDFLSGNLTDIKGALNFNAGSGRHRLMISNEGSPVGSTDARITSNAASLPNTPANLGLDPSAEIWVTGIAPAGISYQADPTNGNFFDGITYWTGSGDDTILVNGTHRRPGGRTMTLLNTGLGDDKITVNLTAGKDDFFVLNAGGGSQSANPSAFTGTVRADDNVDASASTLPLVIFGDWGQDTIKGGQGGDIILGHFGRVQYTDPVTGQIIASVGAGGHGDFTTSQIVGPASIYSHDVTIGANDIIYGGATGNTIIAGAGNDTVYGGAGNDIIIGNDAVLTYAPVSGANGATSLVSITPGTVSGNNLLYGVGGNDIIVGGVGSDEIHGGTGNNILVGDNAYIHFNASQVVDQIASINNAQGGNDSIYGGLSNDTIIGGAGNDLVHGGAGNDIIIGNDAVLNYAPISGTAGPERLVDITPGTAPGNNTLYGGGGNNTIIGGVGNDYIRGGRGTNILVGDNAYIHFNASQVVDHIASINNAQGGNDTIYGGASNDTVIGGAGNDLVHGGAGNDIIIGNDAVLNYAPISGTAGPERLVDITPGTAPGDNTLYGGGGNNTIIGGVGNDYIRGGPGTNILVGDNAYIHYNVNQIVDHIESINRDQGGNNTVYGGASDDIIIGGPRDDSLDGGAGKDLIFGNNVILDRTATLGNFTDPRFRALGGTQIYSTSASTAGQALIDSTQQFVDPRGTAWWADFQINLIDHDTSTPSTRYGNNYIAGGPGEKMIFGGLGNDTIQGHGSIDLTPKLYFYGADQQIIINRLLTLADIQYNPGNPADVARATNIVTQINSGHVGAWRLVPTASFATEIRTTNNLPATWGTNLSAMVTGYLFVRPSVENFDHFDASGNPVSLPGNDGSAYIEGGGGNDTIFGDGGQNDIIGGSSDLFGLSTPAQRPSGSNLIFGGAGTDISRNDLGDTSPGGHARDSDMIISNNGDIFRLVGVNHVLGGGGVVATFNGFLSFNYDSASYENYTTEPLSQQLRIIPRAAKLLDYTPGGPAFNPAAASDIGGSTEIHGENGDNFIFGEKGNNQIYGGGQNNQIVGGYGTNWISGGAGSAAIIATDGRIFASVNGLAEPLNGVTAIPASQLNLTISTPGHAQSAMINIAGQFKTTVDLEPFSEDPTWNASAPEWQGGVSAPHQSDDIIFGGIGSDTVHGGSGDDAISGGEALPVSYVQAYDANNNLTGVAESDYYQPYNPGNVLRFNPSTGQFALYDEFDPRRKVLLNPDGTANKTGTGLPWFLDLNTSDGTGGNDRLFGDLGNNWIVSGTGQNDLFGGFGNDLLDARSSQDIDGGLNDQPNNAVNITNRAFGGAGKDVLIADNEADRLIDWVGNFNTYLVPFPQFGMPTISRTVQPQLPEFLYALSASDGVDMTRAADVPGADPTRNGEPFGELGLVLQQDAAWHQQTGAPSAPTGHIAGSSSRVIIRSVTFNGNQAPTMFPDSGTWTAAANYYQGAASPGGDAVSLFNFDTWLPGYYELTSSFKISNDGTQQNAFLIFDYQSNANFKYAGLDAKLGLLRIGQRTAKGWIDAVTLPYSVHLNAQYSPLLAVNGADVTLSLGSTSLSYTFSGPLNTGLLGVGVNSAVARFSSIQAQKLPRVFTYQVTPTISSTGLSGFNVQSGQGSVTSTNRFALTPPVGGPALSLRPLNVAPYSYVEFQSTVNAGANGTWAGVAFAYTSLNDFLFAAIVPGSNQVILGHRNPSGWFVDAVAAQTITAGTDYTLLVAIDNSPADGITPPMVNVVLNGVSVAAYSYNFQMVAGPTQGNLQLGLLTRNGAASFYNLSIRGDDPAYTGGGTPQLAATPLLGNAATVALRADQLQPIITAAIQYWETSPSFVQNVSVLTDVPFVIDDLPGQMLAQTIAGTIVIDPTAAGYGWYVDATPFNDTEFNGGTGASGIQALPSSPAYGRMDLLTVVMHELGHVVGFGDQASVGPSRDLMSTSLPAGTRRLPSYPDVMSADSRSGVPASPSDEMVSVELNRGTGPSQVSAFVTPVADFSAAPLVVVAQGSAPLTERRESAQNLRAQSLVFQLGVLIETLFADGIVTGERTSRFGEDPTLGYATEPRDWPRREFSEDLLSHLAGLPNAVVNRRSPDAAFAIWEPLGLPADEALVTTLASSIRR